MLGNILLKMNKAYFVVGLNYGDEGKGSVVDFLAMKSNADTIVRFNGGSQAAHNVVDGQREHCFSQFGSGTFIEGTKTYLSPFMYVNPISLMVEEEALQKKGVSDAYKRLFINEGCAIITPFQKYVGRMRELIQGNSSCGMGVGETVRDTIGLGDAQLRIGDLKDKQTLEDKLDFLRRVKLDHAEQVLNGSQDVSTAKRYLEELRKEEAIGAISREYRNFASKVNIVDSYELRGTMIFEGAQGVLLDILHGFFPFVTKTDSTFANAVKLAYGIADVKRIGVLRGYSTRHGKGPFLSEDKSLKSISPNEHNKSNRWQGNFRTGWFDLIASRYALDVVGGVDLVALTNLDCLRNLTLIKVCVGYQSDKEVSGDHFVSERSAGRTLIRAIKPNKHLSDEDKIRRTDVLMNSSPVYREFKNLDTYLQFLESEGGLGVPIGIRSYGSAREDKLF